MGTCQSQQNSVVVADAHGRKPQTGSGRGQNTKSSNPVTRSAVSHGTGMTSVESSELLECAAHPTCSREVASVPEEEAALPPMDFISDLPIMDAKHQMPRPKHVMHNISNSDRVIDYLREEGASSNRIMVHIETPMGARIEEIYDGVHDGKVLGEGIAGKVRLITHKDTSIQRAVKRLDLGLVTRDEDLNRLLEEIKIMCALDHPNIVCLEEVYEGASELYLTQELCDGGDLFDRLDAQSNYSYTEAECARLVKQIISSVSYLHSKNIIHRDLKLENFLFSDKTSSSCLKMIDFGLSKHFQLGEIQHETVGTPYTVAPEVILGEGYDEKCDIWAIGVIAFLLLSGDAPFGGACEGEDLMQVRQNILAGNVSFDSNEWGNVSDLAISFIKSLLLLDPEKRPSAEEAQDHPWIQLMKRSSSLGGEESFLDPKVVNGLVSYKELSSSHKFLSEVLSFTLQPSQISGLREEFEKMDTSGKGEISLTGFKDALLARSEQCLMSEVEIEEIFNGLKVRNTDLAIRWHEFIAACLSQCRIDDRNIRLAFDRLDTDHKGYITLKDLKNAMDFYGSGFGIDLQKMWVNNIIDYKCDKENMTYDDFYELLKLDRQSDNPKQILSKSAPPQRKRATKKKLLMRSMVGTNQPNIDQDLLNGFSFDDTSPCMRHPLEGTVLHDDEESDLISNVKEYKRMNKFILEASKHIGEEKPNSNEMRGTNSICSKGLILRRESYEKCPRQLRRRVSQ